MIYIQRYLEKLKNFQSQNAKDFTMSLTEANNLHQDITKLLIELKALSESKSAVDAVVEVELKGEDF
jgi:hypothetical protein